MIDTIIFDGDDTLWDTQPIYSRALALYYKLLKVDFPHRSAHQNKEEFTQYNLEYAKRAGFGERYMGDLMVRFWQDINRQQIQPNTARHEEDIRRIGDAVYTTMPSLLPYAKSCLEQLYFHGFQLVLYTAGHGETQLNKVNASGLRKYFDALWIVPMKTTDILDERIMALDLDPDEVAVVGNSIPSDILPALEVGAHAIYVPNKTWAYDDVRTARTGFVTAESLKDVPAQMELIQNSAAA